MDFTTVTTPAELISANEVNPVGDTLDIVNKLTPEQGLELVAAVIEQLGCWHRITADNLTEKGEHERAQEWVRDDARLEQAYMLVRTVLENSID